MIVFQFLRIHPRGGLLRGALLLGFDFEVALYNFKLFELLVKYYMFLFLFCFDYFIFLFINLNSLFKLS